MIRKSFAVLLVAASLGVSGAALAQSPVMVGGAPMYANKTIAQNAPEAPNLTTLVAAVKAAGLVDTLASKGPFTVFAPTNDAFGKLPKGTVETLVKPENKATLTKILTYHVVAGDYSAERLMREARRNGGEVRLKTVEGEPLTVKLSGKKLTVIDRTGKSAAIQTPDVKQSNGVVHVIGSVLMPKMKAAKGA
ncbi:beta-Ig-H3/fasciclin [Aureimonas ureilytica]|uniref:Beta-Ig-H3/fasciclin n=1 Tax=Aureimonas ureilytica TaxID=401562 RepID=A0A175R3K9_9HYPH|nr:MULTISPECIES: fasciclin domain-containing protein [Aureimonas]KTQ85365.1 beta-Ig-H3/fasciclin [Aureimonas ureilytica]KTR06712.1 beta-Ig-H3/fasciclin [Aureimonas ureilytica]